MPQINIHSITPLATACFSDDMHVIDQKVAGVYTTMRIPYSTLISNLDASSIATGTINIARLPAAAIERLKIVTNQAARFALTTADVQTGDTVKQSADGLMFFVKDDTNLGNSSGYEPYTVGSASSVPWSGVTSTPTTLSGYGITDGATTSQVNAKMTNPMTTAADLIVGGASGAPTRLAVGTDGYFLSVVSGVITWVAGVALSVTNLWTKNQTVTPIINNSVTGTYTPDASTSNSFRLKLTGNTTLADPSNLSDGMVLNFFIKQDATGGRTLTLGSKYTALDGSPTGVAVGANTLTLITGYFDATDNLYYYNMSKKA